MGRSAGPKTLYTTEIVADVMQLLDRPGNSTSRQAEATQEMAATTQPVAQPIQPLVQLRPSASPVNAPTPGDASDLPF